MNRLTQYCLIGALLMTSGCNDKEKQAVTTSIEATVDGVSYHGVYRVDQSEGFVEIVSPIALSSGQSVSVSSVDNGGSGFALIGDSGEKFAGKAGEFIFIHKGQPLPYEISVDIHHKDSEAARNSISAALTQLTNKSAEQAGAGQPATSPKSKPEGNETPKPESQPVPR